MIFFNRFQARTLLFIGTLIISTISFCQNEESERETQNKLSQKVDVIESPPQTRANIEGGLVDDYLHSDIKGVSLSLGGFIQTDLFWDQRDQNLSDAFSPFNIPINAERNREIYYSIKQSRLYFKSNNLYDSTKKKSLNTIFEFDLYTPNSTPRVRLAYGEFKILGVGQYWSNYGAIEAWPNIMDYWGPCAMIFARIPQVRVKVPMKDDKHKVIFSA